mgnify:CR=1 FL=1
MERIKKEITFKRGPEKTKEVDPKTYQPTGGVHTKQSSRDKVILKNTNRRESKPKSRVEKRKDEKRRVEKRREEQSKEEQRTEAMFIIIE